MGVELLNIDCMEYMATQEDNAFDLAIVDPPYGIEVNHNMGRRAGDVSSDYKKVDWDCEPPPAEYFDELFRVSDKVIIWGANHFMDLIGKRSSCWIVWDKKFSVDVSFASCELAFTNFDTVVKRFSYSSARKNGIHPTQKPRELYNWLLHTYATKDQRILDTHLGSGSSAIEGHYFGCDFVGCEIDKDYFEATQKRFKKETAQLSLF